MSVLEELKGTKAQIEYLLDKYPATRNSDGYLILLWLKEFKHWPISFVEWGNIEDASVDSAIRLRQLIQNKERRYQPTDEAIRQKRQERASKYRRAITQA